LSEGSKKVWLFKKLWYTSVSQPSGKRRFCDVVV